MLQTLDRFEVAGKSILVRANVNVPIADGQGADDALVRASIMAIDEIVEQERQRDYSRVPRCESITDITILTKRVSSVEGITQPSMKRQTATRVVRCDQGPSSLIADQTMTQVVAGNLL